MYRFNRLVVMVVMVVWGFIGGVSGFDVNWYWYDLMNRSRIEVDSDLFGDIWWWYSDGVMGEMWEQPFSFGRSWGWRDDKGNMGTIEREPFSVVPTYRWMDNWGRSGRMEVRERPFSFTPMYDIYILDE